jgi:hypothetical protein
VLLDIAGKAYAPNFGERRGRGLKERSGSFFRALAGLFYFTLLVVKGADTSFIFVRAANPPLTAAKETTAPASEAMVNPPARKAPPPRKTAYVSAAMEGCK